MLQESRMHVHAMNLPYSHKPLDHVAHGLLMLLFGLNPYHTTAPPRMLCYGQSLQAPMPTH